MLSTLAMRFRSRKMSFPTILRRSLPTWLVLAVPLRDGGSGTMADPRAAAGAAHRGGRRRRPRRARRRRAASPPTAATPRARTPTRSRATPGAGCPTFRSPSTMRRRRARAGTSTSSAGTAATATRSRPCSCSGKDETWRSLPALPDARAAAAAAIAGGKLYVLGGVDGRRGLARVAFALDLKTRRWARIPGPVAARAPRGRRGRRRASTPSAAAAPGSTRTRARFEVYDATHAALDAAGPDPAGARRHRRGLRERDGSSRSAASARRARSRSVYTYVLRTKRWQRLPDLPTPRHGLGVVAAGGRVYVVAGGPQPGLTVSGAVESVRP